MTNAGHLDPTFGGGSGYVMIPVMPGSPIGQSEYNSTVVEPNGSILVEGPITDFHSFGVAHLKADGSTDASFGSAGVASLTLAAGRVLVGTYPTTSHRRFFSNPTRRSSSTMSPRRAT